MEQLTTESIPDHLRESLLRGTDELDLVRSGLEETMITALDEILAIRNRRRGVSLRTAAYISAIEKVGMAYLELGVFP
jgi:glutamate dehydrogenase (NAD(P)+)